MLIKSTIDQAQPRAGAYIIWDSDLAGFGCRIFPSGKKSFIAQYRMPGSRRVIRHTIGPYGLLTVPEARAAARKVLAQAHTGADPQAPKKARQAAEARRASMLTVAALVEQYLTALRAGTTITSNRGPAVTVKYVEHVAGLLGHFVGACGKQDAGELTRASVTRWLDDYTSGPQDKKGRIGNPGRPGARTNMLGAIRRMYRWGQRNDLLTIDPTQHIEAPKPRARERVLSLAELVRIWHAAEQLTPLSRDSVRLLILTGQRCTEVGGMSWRELDLDKALWTLPGRRTKAKGQHVVPLPARAIVILQARRDGLQHAPEAEDFVLPSTSRDGTRIIARIDWQYIKRELDRCTSIEGWVLHDFRRSIVSNCAEAGGDLAALDSILNHASSATRGGVVGVYQRATLIEPMRKMMALWDRLLSEAIDPPASPKVVPLRA